MIIVDFFLYADEKKAMSSHDVNVPEPIPIPVFISIVLKCIIETTVCLCVIIINILLIVSLIYIKRLRTTQNLLLINVSFACIVFSLSCIMSTSLTISVVYTKQYNSYVVN